MSKGKKGYAAVSQDEEWIEMEDLRLPQNQDLSQKLAQEPANPQPLAQQAPMPPPNPSFKPQPPPQQYQQPRPANPPASRAPSVPMMQVACEYCTVMQSVPGNTQVWICGSCENMNECEALYGVLVCGCCRKRVAWGIGTSEYVKCPNCDAINRVPLECDKNYMAGSGSQPQAQQQAGFVPQQQAVAQKQQQDLMDFYDVDEWEREREKPPAAKVDHKQEEKQRELQRQIEEKAKKELQRQYQQKARRLEEEYRQKERALQSRLQEMQQQREQQGSNLQRESAYEPRVQEFNKEEDQYMPASASQTKPEPGSQPYPDL